MCSTVGGRGRRRFHGGRCKEKNADLEAAMEKVWSVAKGWGRSRNSGCRIRLRRWRPTRPRLPSVHGGCSDMNRRHWPWVASTVALLAAVGFVVLFGSMRPASETAPPAAAKPHGDRIIGAGASRIDEEGRRALPPPAVEAAPRRRTGIDTARPQSEPPPTPPEGYSFVDHFGEMAKTHDPKHALMQPASPRRRNDMPTGPDVEIST